MAVFWEKKTKKTKKAEIYKEKKKKKKKTGRKFKIMNYSLDTCFYLDNLKAKTLNHH